jgi:tRNA A37 threonylcarbamoyladenosine dehydratase
MRLFSVKAVTIVSLKLISILLKRKRAPLKREAPLLSYWLYYNTVFSDCQIEKTSFVIIKKTNFVIKLELVMNSKASETPIISSMGAGNKVSAAAFEVADIYETSVCPLARVMRYECRKRGIDSLKVVYSKEKPIRPLEDMSISCRKHCICPPGTARKCTQRRDIPGSTAFVPSAAGLIIAGEVIKDLIEFDRGER